MGILKARINDQVVEQRVCFDQKKCDELMAQFDDGIVVPGKTKGTTDAQKAWFARKLERAANPRVSKKQRKESAFSKLMRKGQEKIAAAKEAAKAAKQPPGGPKAGFNKLPNIA